MSAEERCAKLSRLWSSSILIFRVEDEIRGTRERMNHFEESRCKSEEEIMLPKASTREVLSIKLSVRSGEEEMRIGELEERVEVLSEQKYPPPLEEKRQEYNEVSQRRLQIMDALLEKSKEGDFRLTKDLLEIVLHN